jgi:hypothetical protein
MLPFMRDSISMDTAGLGSSGPVGRPLRRAR